MKLIRGVAYNFKGLWMGIKTPRLLFWGLIRFFVIILITILAASLILVYHKEILELIWTKPESTWLLWLWYVLSWFLSLVLVAVSTVIAYVLAQILFSVIIMDRMSRITELKITGKVTEPEGITLFRQFSYLVRQEIPRATIPIVLTLVFMLLGMLTPLGPVLAILSSGIVIIFLAWDNTDLVPARRFLSLRERFGLLLKSLLFHLGFGLPFLVPVLNILLLSFAPVGGTLYYLEEDSASGIGVSSPASSVPPV